MHSQSSLDWANAVTSVVDIEGHCSHPFLSPALLYFAGRHFVHSVSPLDSENLPWMQTEHAFSSFSWPGARPCFPGGHGVHAESEGVASDAAYRPRGQSWHVVTLVAPTWLEYFPTGQPTVEPWSGETYVPATACWHAVDPAEEKNPVSQPLHSLFSKNFPAAH
jgi:hypothetical protein